MKRKVSKIGPATLMVSLPSKWAREQNIKKGDEIELTIIDNILKISPSDKELKKGKTVMIDMTRLGVSGGRSIGALYKAGVDEIHIRYENPEQLAIIQNNIRDLIGFEMVRQSANKCIIKEVSIASEEDFPMLMNRTFLLIESVVDDGYAVLENKQYDALQSLIERDLAINRFSNYLRRILNMSYQLPHVQRVMTYFIVNELENMGDEYKALFRLIQEDSKGLTKEFFQIMLHLNQHIREFHSLWQKFSPEKANEYELAWKEIKKKLEKLLEYPRGEHRTRYAYLYNINERLFNVFKPLLSMKLSEEALVQEEK
ncbi:MAG: AbrB/MazE/SpoVT family DNA-binding domain-containing protein [Nanoarchaeota archaeon]